MIGKLADPHQNGLAMQQGPSLEVVCALISLNNRVLAARRDSVRAYPLLWEFPGGKRERGESAEVALHRELQEELRFNVTIVKKLQPVDYSDDVVSIRLLPYLCRPAQDAAPVPVDHIELRWITVDESRQLTWAPADIPLVDNLPNLINL